jgi:hypothetical protein
MRINSTYKKFFQSRDAYDRLTQVEDAYNRLTHSHDALCYQLSQVQDALCSQVNNLTASLLKNSAVFDEGMYRTLNPIFSQNYEEQTQLSGQYRTTGEEYYSCTFLRQGISGVLHTCLSSMEYTST